MRVLFFARLREALGESSMTVPDDLGTVAELRSWLQREAPPPLAEALAAPNVFCAVNQRVVEASHSVEPGDEIAFFPPVTGG